MQRWKALLSELHIPEAVLVHQSVFDPARRTYSQDDLIYKVAARDAAPVRSQTLEGEAAILTRLSGVAGVPEVVSIRTERAASVMTTRRIPGNTFVPGELGLFRTVVLLIRLMALLFRISQRGVAHNDLRLENIVVGSGNRPYLVDFDQAEETTKPRALLRNFAGRGKTSHLSHWSFPNLMVRSLAANLPKWIKQGVTKATRKHHHPSLEAGSVAGVGIDVNLLTRAWEIAAKSNASSPGVPIAYYSLGVDRRHFHGERPWLSRWDILKDVTGYEDRRILELGCNMGLLSTFLKRERGAAQIVAIDVDPDVIKAAQLVTQAFGVEIDLRVLDLDDSRPWEDELLRFAPDVVFALNVLNWLEDKDRLLRFLGKVPEVIFEGHDSVEIEIARLEALGFEVCFVGVTERNRPLLRAIRP